MPELLFTTTETRRLIDMLTLLRVHLQDQHHKAIGEVRKWEALLEDPLWGDSRMGRESMESWTATNDQCLSDMAFVDQAMSHLAVALAEGE